MARQVHFIPLSSAPVGSLFVPHVRFFLTRIIIAASLIYAAEPLAVAGQPPAELNGSIDDAGGFGAILDKVPVGLVPVWKIITVGNSSQNEEPSPLGYSSPVQWRENYFVMHFRIGWNRTLISGRRLPMNIINAGWKQFLPSPQRLAIFRRSDSNVSPNLSNNHRFVREALRADRNWQDKGPFYGDVGSGGTKRLKVLRRIDKGCCNHGHGSYPFQEALYVAPDDLPRPRPYMLIVGCLLAGFGGIMFRKESINVSICGAILWFVGLVLVLQGFHLLTGVIK